MSFMIIKIYGTKSVLESEDVNRIIVNAQELFVRNGNRFGKDSSTGDPSDIDTFLVVPVMVCASEILPNDLTRTNHAVLLEVICETHEQPAWATEFITKSGLSSVNGTRLVSVCFIMGQFVVYRGL